MLLCLLFLRQGEPGVSLAGDSQAENEVEESDEEQPIRCVHSVQTNGNCKV